MALANVKKKRTSQQEQQQQQPQDPFPHKLELSAKKYDPTKLGPWVKDTFPGNHQIEWPTDSKTNLNTQLNANLTIWTPRKVDESELRDFRSEKWKKEHPEEV